MGVVFKKESGYPDDAQISFRRDGESGQDEEFSCRHIDLDVPVREPSRDVTYALSIQVRSRLRMAGWGRCIHVGRLKSPRERIEKFRTQDGNLRSLII